MEEIKQEQEPVLNLSFKTNIKTINIGGHLFQMNLDDPEVYKALYEFKEEHVSIQAVQEDVDGLLEDCAEVIDIVLGEGTVDKVIPERDMKLYLLVNELASIFMDFFMKEERDKAKAKQDKELAGIKEIINGIDTFNKMMSYADSKYMNNRKARRNVSKSKSSKKHKGRK